MKNGIGTLHRRTITAWVLIAGILLQPIVTYLATPHLADDGKGHYVLLCTLNGLQQVYVGDLQALGEQSDEEHCPALKLVQLGGVAQPTTPLQIPDTALFLVGTVDITTRDQHQAHHFSLYPIRAPPMA